MVVVTLLLCLVPVWEVQAAPLEIDSKRVDVTVETEGIEAEQAQRLREGLEQSLGAELEASGFEFVEDQGDATLEAHVDLRDTELGVYAISVSFVVGDERESLIDMAPCVACPEQDLVAETLKVLPDLRDYLPVEPEPEPEPALEPEPPPPDLPVEPEPAPLVPAKPDDLRGQLGIGPLGLTGVAFLSAGVVSLGAGGLMMSMPDLDYRRDPRKAGVGVLALGAVSAAAGAALVAVDVLVVQRRRNIQIAADVAPTHAGLRVSGRF